MYFNRDAGFAFVGSILGGLFGLFFNGIVRARSGEIVKLFLKLKRREKGDELAVVELEPEEGRLRHISRRSELNDINRRNGRRSTSGSWRRSERRERRITVDII